GRRRARPADGQHALHPPRCERPRSLHDRHRAHQLDDRHSDAALATDVDTMAIDIRAKIEGRDLCKTYVSARTGEKVQALNNVSFAIGSNEFVGIVGPSGCGKSTLLSLVAGFNKPTAGEVLVDGVPVTAPDPQRGVMFQDYALFPWRTVLGNVEF